MVEYIQFLILDEFVHLSEIYSETFIIRSTRLRRFNLHKPRESEGKRCWNVTGGWKIVMVNGKKFYFAKSDSYGTIERFTNSSWRLLLVVTGFTTEIQFISPKLKTRSYEDN